MAGSIASGRAITHSLPYRRLLWRHGEDVGLIPLGGNRQTGKYSLVISDHFSLNERLLVGLSFGYSGTVTPITMGILRGEKSSLCLRRDENILANDMNYPDGMMDYEGALVVSYLRLC